MSETEKEIQPAEIHDQADERKALPEHMIPNDHDRTLEGHLELLQDLKATQRALNLDFRTQMLADRATLHRLADPKLAQMNNEREIPVDVSSVSDTFLVGLVQPNWSEHMPTSVDGDEKDEAWEAFKAGYPENTQINLEEMRVLRTKVGLLEDDEALQDKISQYQVERVNTLRAAAIWRVAERKQKKLGKEIAALRMSVAASHRPLTKAEKSAILGKQEQIKELDTERESQIDSPEIRDSVTAELALAETLDQKRQLDNGLLLDRQMQQIIDESLPALARGEPMLIVGETGGAKTALALYISRQYFDEPEFVSGYGDANSYQLMGKSELREENGASVSEYIAGPVVRAMERGIPLILDEINAMPPELLKRLNLISQLRPGDTFTVQEDSGRVVTVAPGFCIIATMNEKSKRYKGVDDLSVEFQNRFGANIYRVRYPDSGKRFTDDPLDNGILVNAAIIDKDGNLPPEIDRNDLWNLVNAARVSQQIFSGEHGEGYGAFMPAERTTDAKPGLEEAVLAPRTLVAIVRQVAGSFGETTIDMALRRFVDGIKDPTDRQVMIDIFKGHTLMLDPVPEVDPAATDPTATDPTAAGTVPAAGAPAAGPTSGP